MHCWFAINKYFIISYSHSYSHSIDVDGLRNFVLNCSKYNLVNQINNNFDNDRTRFSSFSASERNAVFVSCNSMLSVFLEWLFREQEHLNMKSNQNGMGWDGMGWKSTCCLQIGSVFKWIHSIMNVVFSEIWNVYSNQIKSNQIKSYFPISHIP